MARKFIFPILISLLLVIVFQRDLILNISLPSGDSPDQLYQYFILNNNFVKLSSLDFSNLFSTRMFYPKTNTLAFGNSELGESIIGLPFYRVTHSTIISTHIVILISFFLSYLFCYYFIFKLTKSKSGSAIGALIFTYNPFVMSHTHIEILTLIWIPLSFICVEELLKAIKPLKYTVLLFCCLFIQLISGFYYFYFLVISLPIYFIIRLYFEKAPVKKFLNPFILISIITFGVVCFLYLMPFLTVKMKYKGQTERSLDVVTALSALPQDFLFANPNNMIYGWANNSLPFRDGFSLNHPTEHSLFPGLIALGLFTWCILLLTKGKFGPDKKTVLGFLILFFISATFSLGPYLQIFGFQLPLPYLLLYKFLPFLSNLRAISRFAVIAYLSLAVLSGFTFSYFFNKSMLVFVAFIFLITLEYITFSSSPILIDPQILTFYSWLQSQKKIHTIVELPIANNIQGYQDYERSYYDDSIYLLYAIYHDKNIVNGYNSFIPEDSAKFGSTLTVSFPTRPKINYLKKIGVNLVVVHKNEFKNLAIWNSIKMQLQQLTVQAYSSDQISAFRL